MTIAALYSPTSGCKLAVIAKLEQRSGGKYKSKQ